MPKRAATTAYVPEEERVREGEEHRVRRFTDEGATNILAFFDGVREVIERLLAEGYTLQDGRLMPPERSDKDGEFENTE